MEKIDGCAWWVHILGVGCGPNKVPYHTFMSYQYQLLTLRQSKVMLSRNKVPKCGFSRGFALKPSILGSKQSTGTWAKKSLWDQFSSAKKLFLTWYETSSKHHRRCLEVQRTCLKPFLTSEPQWGLLKLPGPAGPKIGIFWAEISDGCAYVCKHFLVGCAGRRGPKGSYLRGKSCPTSLRYLVLKIENFE